MSGNSSLIERQITNLIRSAVDADLVDRDGTGVLGTPDLVSRRARVAVFVDGCYWHGCLKHTRDARAGERRARDAKVTAGLIAQGWEVLRVWEHEEHLAPFLAKAAAAINRRAAEQQAADAKHLRDHAPGEWCHTCEQWPHVPIPGDDCWCIRCDVHARDHEPVASCTPSSDPGDAPSGPV